MRACSRSTKSLGADGIVATNDIQLDRRSQGQGTVAFAERTVSQFYLNVLLKEAGLSEADIETVNLSGDDAGNAFLMQEVDAAVTAGSPGSRRARRPAHGHLLADTSETPGLVVDCLVTKNRRSSMIAWRSSRRWRAPGMRRCDYVEAHPDEANEIMARNVGGWLEDPAVFAETLKGVGSTIPRETGNTSAPRSTPARSTRPSQYGHRRLVEPRRARGPGDARRRDPARPLGPSSGARGIGKEHEACECISPASSPLSWSRQAARRPRPSRCGSAISPGSATGRCSSRRRRASSPRKASRSS